jgi:hypothetical protein
MDKIAKFNENSSQAFNSHCTVANRSAIRLTWSTPGRHQRRMSNIATHQADMTSTAGTQLPRDNGTCNDILKMTFVLASLHFRKDNVHLAWYKVEVSLYTRNVIMPSPFHAAHYLYVNTTSNVRQYSVQYSTQKWLLSWGSYPRHVHDTATSPDYATVLPTYCPLTFW